MADEIKVTSRLTCVNGSLDVKFQPSQFSFDQATGLYYDVVSNIGTTEESIGTFGDISTEGWGVMINLDATNYVQWGFSTGVYGGRMEAGEVAGPFRLEPGLTLYLKANTAACNVRVLVLSD